MANQYEHLWISKVLGGGFAIVAVPIAIFAVGEILFTLVVGGGSYLIWYLARHFPLSLLAVLLLRAVRSLLLGQRVWATAWIAVFVATAVYARWLYDYWTIRSPGYIKWDLEYFRLNLLVVPILIIVMGVVRPSELRDAVVRGWYRVSRPIVRF